MIFVTDLIRGVLFADRCSAAAAAAAVVVVRSTRHAAVVSGRDMTTKIAKSAGDQSEDSLDHMLLFFNLSIRKLAFVGVSLPLITLLTCLATAYVFQYDDVHETHCQVSSR